MYSISPRLSRAVPRARAPCVAHRYLGTSDDTRHRVCWSESAATTIRIVTTIKTAHGPRAGHGLERIGRPCRGDRDQRGRVRRPYTSHFG